MMRLHVMAIVVAMLLAAGGPALASPESESEELIVRGVELRRHSEHGAALELFERAFELNPSGRALAQRGLAELSLRRWLAAERHLEAALAHHDSPWIEAKETREVLGKALAGARQHVGTVRIEGPDGAEVTVDDRAVGRLPLATQVRVAEGETHVVLKLRGRPPMPKSAQVTGGAEVVVRFDAEPERKQTSRPVAGSPATAPRLTAIAAPPAPRPTAPPPATVATAISKQESDPRSSPGRPGAFWAGSALLAAGTGALATGIVWLVVDANGTCDGVDCSHRYDTSTQGWIAAAGGAALAIGGAALIVLSPTPDRALAVGVSPTGVHAVGRF